MHENHASIVALHRLKTFFKKSADTFASTQYIDILDQHLPTAYEKFLPQSSRKILLQQDNARPHVSIKTRKYFKKKKD